MIKEIKRTGWAKFFKNFSNRNQYRWMSVNYIDKKQAGSGPLTESYFLGITLEKKGRLIDGINLYAGWTNPENVSHPVVSIKKPARITVEISSDGIDQCLNVESEDGLKASVDLSGFNELKQQQDFVRKVAFSIYEQRGCQHGNDWEDWLKAENLVKKAEEQFV